MSSNNVPARRTNRQQPPPPQALERIPVQLPSGPLDKLEDLADMFEQLRGKVNLLTPLVSVDTILPMHQVSLRAVYIDSTVNSKGFGRECYRSPVFCDEDEVVLGGVALDKLEAAAGIRRIAGGRVDDRSVRYLCEFSVTLEMIDFDGTPRTAVGTKEVDLRDGAPATLKAEWVKDQKSGFNSKTGRMIPIDPAQLAAKREHMLSNCETKARFRALRHLLSLPQKLKLEDLQKPFVVPKLVPKLDASDPETKTALLALATGQSAALYGSRHNGNDRAQLPAESMPPIKQIGGSSFIEDHTAEVNETGTRNQEATSQDSDDLTSFGEPPAPIAQRPHYECGCTCGHGAAITEKVALWTEDKLGGSMRCASCYPWNKSFDFKAHEPDRDLGIKSHPGLTPPEIQQQGALPLK